MTDTLERGTRHASYLPTREQRVCGQTCAATRRARTQPVRDRQYCACDRRGHDLACRAAGRPQRARPVQFLQGDPPRQPIHQLRQTDEVAHARESLNQALRTRLVHARRPCLVRRPSRIPVLRVLGRSRRRRGAGHRGLSAVRSDHRLAGRRSGHGMEGGRPNRAALFHDSLQPHPGNNGAREPEWPHHYLEPRRIFLPSFLPKRPTGLPTRYPNGANSDGVGNYEAATGGFGAQPSRNGLPPGRSSIDRGSTRDANRSFRGHEIRSCRSFSS